jgi:signal peptidase I
VKRKKRRERKPSKRALFDLRFVRTEQRRSYRLAVILFWSIISYFFFERLIVTTGIVTDQSMVPSLLENQYCIVEKYPYHFGLPRRGDIVALHASAQDEELLVKRVVATAGETLTISGGRVRVNGQLISEPHASGETRPDMGPLLIKPDHYFVMGDNRAGSEDSRHFGPVSRKNIKGKVRV